MMKVLVLGGYGAVGRHVVDALRAGGDAAYAAGRDPRRADRVVDLGDGAGGTYLDALAGVDVVVNAAGAEDPALAEAACSRGTAFVDVTATTPYVARLEALSPAAPLLVGIGLAPGLTTLLAAAVLDAAPGRPVDVAIVLGAGERHGAAATEWSYGLLGRTFPDAEDGPPVRNYSRPAVIDLPGGTRRRLYRADFSDQHTLTREFGVPVRTYFGLDSRLATLALATLTRIPGGSRAPRGLHLPGSDRWTVVARSRRTGVARRTGHRTGIGTGGAAEVGGSVTAWASGRSQSRATAAVAVRAARAAVGTNAGVHHLHHLLSLDELRLDEDEIDFPTEAAVAIHPPA
ncbi:hypothetical protein [Embleya sp. AB8]|uniref:hypothetical protein n=1 Tax=Embleya sp. AB8 TaxID=3156304 RepID=UPI003C74D9B5